MLDVIKVGDYVGVEGDRGVVTNAPWMQKVVKIEGEKFFFNEGSTSRPYLVGYKLSANNFECVGRNRYDNNAKVFIFTH